MDFAAGFTIPLVGLGASAQTRYDHDAKLTYYFGSEGRLCSTSKKYSPATAPLDEMAGDH